MTLHALTIRGIPAPVLKALRAAAKHNRRSLNAEVLVRLEAGALGAPAEPEGQSYEVRKAFEEARVSLLESELKLTPEERVRLADQMLDDALRVRPRPNVHTVRAFDTWEDYLLWKKTDFLR